MDFTKLTDQRILAKHLGFEDELISRLLTRSIDDFDILHLEKRRGGHRKVVSLNRQDARLFYKELGTKLLLFGEETGWFHSAASAYRKGMSPFKNAFQHVGRARYLLGDIRNFFPSIGTERVRHFLKTKGLRPNICEVLANLLTIGGHLALGLSPTPAIANAIAFNLDERLARICPPGTTYTRYSDDMTFSSDGNLPSIQEIVTIIEAEGFKPAKEKFRQRKRGQGVFVTGLSVEGTRPRAPRRLKNRLRQELFWCEKFGVEAHLGHRYATITSGWNKIGGQIAYLQGIEPDLGNAFFVRWKRMGGGSFHSEKERPPRSGTIIIDETDIEGGIAIGLAIVDTADVPAISERIRRHLDEQVSNPHAVTPFPQRKGLHYVELADTERGRLSDLIGTIPLRMFVVFDTRRPNERKVDCYRRVLKKVLIPRLSPYSEGDVSIMFEQRSDFSESDFRESLRCWTESVEDAERPAIKKVESVSKEELLVVLPDSLLGILRRAMTEGAHPFEKARFNQHRSRFRMIHSMVDGSYFDRTTETDVIVNAMRRVFPGKK